MESQKEHKEEKNQTNRPTVYHLSRPFGPHTKVLVATGLEVLVQIGWTDP